MSEAALGATATEATDWFTCRIWRTGLEGDRVVLHLEEVNGLFGGRPPFQPRPEVRREVLAVALTAASTGMRVNVQLTSTEPWSEIVRIHLNVFD